MSDLFRALLKVQGAVRGVKRDAKNPHFKNTYATLEAVTDTIRPHMQDAGLVWLQAPGSIRDGSIQVTTTIIHAESGERHEFTMEMPLAKKDPQGAGSALTYACRYSLMAALGLPPTDDDAETAIDRDNTRPEPEVPVKSSASLKRAGSWEALTDNLAQDMVDVRSVIGFEKVRQLYRERAKSEGWPAAWLNALKDEFAHYEREIAGRNIASDIADTFDGATVKDERISHPLMAG
jgi:ERF superfamily